MNKKIITNTILLSVLSFAEGYEINRVAPAKNAIYQKECASCHFGYQPGLLPKQTWGKIMNTLDNHFGTDASLDDKTKADITRYLVNNSSDSQNSNFRINNKNNSIKNLRITKMPYFLREHNEIPKKIIAQKEVGSLLNCTACNKSAEKGIYSEGYIKVPNFRSWDDD